MKVKKQYFTAVDKNIEQNFCSRSVKYSVMRAHFGKQQNITRKKLKTLNEFL